MDVLKPTYRKTWGVMAGDCNLRVAGTSPLTHSQSAK